MTTAIIIGIIIVLCIIAIRSYIKKLSHGCCGAGGDDEKTEVKKTDLSEYKYRYSVKIGGMSCKNCSAKIENALNRQDGIYSRVDLKSGAADIFSKAPVSEFVIRQTVVGLGYSVGEITEQK